MYQDINGIQHETYEDACHYYGADTPAQMEEEARYYEEMERTDAYAAMTADDQEIFYALAGRTRALAKLWAAYHTDHLRDCYAYRPATIYGPDANIPF